MSFKKKAEVVFDSFICQSESISDFFSNSSRFREWFLGCDRVPSPNTRRLFPVHGVNVMAKGATPHPLMDLERFLKIAEFLTYGELSLRDIAAKLEISPTAVSDCIIRLEEHYSTRLVLRAERTSGKNQLTPEALTLLEEIKKILRWTPKRKSLLRIVIANALLTSQLLTPAINAFLRVYKPVLDLQDSLTVERDFEKIAQNLRNHEIDLAIVWGVSPKLKDRDGIVGHVFGRAFDLVLISYDRVELQKTCTDETIRWVDKGKFKTQLANKPIVVLKGENQPLLDQLPNPNLAGGGERIEVDTIDLAVALVRAHVGTFALVPAIFAELDRFRQAEELYYAQFPDESVQLAWFARKPGLQHLPEVAKAFLNFLSPHLETVENSSAWFDQGTNQFPEAAEFYEKFHHAYYVERNPLFSPEPMWYGEKVELKQCNGEVTARFKRKLTDHRLEPNLKFNGTLTNDVGDTFQLECEKVRRMFVIKGKGSAERKPNTSVSEFVSVFTWCSPASGVMFGTWSGRALDHSNEAVLYGTLWSHDDLDLKQIRDYARKANIHLVLNPEREYVRPKQAASNR